MENQKHYVYKILLLFMFIILPQSLMAGVNSVSTISIQVIVMVLFFGFLLASKIRLFSKIAMLIGVLGFSTGLQAACTGTQVGSWDTTSSLSSSDSITQNAHDYYTITVPSNGDLEITVEDTDDGNSDNQVVVLYSDTTCTSIVYSFAMPTANAGIGSDTYTGSVTAGTYTLHISGGDNQDATYNLSASFTAASSNTAPNISVDNQSVDAPINSGDTIFTATATDDDNDSLTFTNISDPRFNILESGEVTAAQDLAADTYTGITITVSDETVSTTSNAFSITVSLNHAPTIDHIDNITALPVIAGTTIFTVTAGDQDIGDNLSYSISDSNFSINNSGQISPNIDLVADSVFTDLTVTVSDDANSTISNIFTITVSESTANHPPFLEDIESQLDIILGEALSPVIDLNATDEDNDTVTFTIIGLPDGVTPANGSNIPNNTTIYGEPLNAGEYNVTVVAADEHNATYSVEFRLKVIDTNESNNSDPVMQDIDDQNVSYNQYITPIVLYATDEDNDTVTFTVSNLPSGLSISNGSGIENNTTITGIAPSGTYTVEVNASDGQGGRDTQTFVIYVSDEPEQPEPAYGHCGIFPSALQTYQTLNIEGSSGTDVINVDNVVATDLVYHSTTITGDGTSTTGEITCQDVGETADEAGDCIVSPPNIEYYTVPFKSTSNTATVEITTSQMISLGDAPNYIVDTANVVVTFNPTKSYSSGRNYMEIGSITNTTNSAGGITYIFNEGDYYIKSWTHTANDITVIVNGKVRIFLDSDASGDSINWSGNDFNINYDNDNDGDMDADVSASDLFIYGSGDFEFTNSGSAKYDIKAFFYTKGDFNLAANSNSGEGFFGGVTAEGDLTLNNNQIFTYEPEGLDADGMGACTTVTVGFSSANYPFSEPTDIYSETYGDVEIRLSEPLEFDLTVEYQTFDYNASDSVAEVNRATKVFDYVENSPNPKQYVIPAGNTTISVPTTIRSDNTIEPDESFYATLKIISTAALSSSETEVLLDIDKTVLTIVSQTDDNLTACIDEDFSELLNWRELGGTSSASLSGGKLQFGSGSTALSKDMKIDMSGSSEMELEFTYYSSCSTQTNGMVISFYNSDIYSPELGEFNSSSLGYIGLEGAWFGLGVYDQADFNDAGGASGLTIRGSTSTDYDNIGPFTKAAGSVGGSNGRKYKLSVATDANSSQMNVTLYEYNTTTEAYSILTPTFNALDVNSLQTRGMSVRLGITAMSSSGCTQAIDDLKVYSYYCTEYNPSRYQQGPFDAWETDSGIDLTNANNNMRIRTHIVNQPFVLWLNSLDNPRENIENKPKAKDWPSDAVIPRIEIAKSATYKNDDILVRYDLYDMETDSVIPNLIDNGDRTAGVSYFNATAEPQWDNVNGPPRIVTIDGQEGEAVKVQRLKTFQVDRAYKEARIRFIMCADFIDSEQKYIVYPYQMCVDELGSPETTGNFAMGSEQADTLLFRYVYSFDRFAIRPDRFSTDLSAGNYIAMDDNLSITFTALDFLNNATQGYNETQGTSFRASLALESGTCEQFTFNLNGQIVFEDGNVTDNYMFPESGRLGFTLSETEGSEFAWIDENDTDWDTVDPRDSRQITPTSVSGIVVRPKYFRVDDIRFTNYNNNNYTHLSGPNINGVGLDTNMTASLTFDVSALKGDDNVSINYESECMPLDNTTMQIEYSTTTIDSVGGVTRLHYYFPSSDTNGSVAVETNGTFSFTLLDSEFDNGVVNDFNLKLNFNKSLTVQTSPFRLNIMDINATDTVNSLNGSADITTPPNATFVYSRLRASESDNYYEDIRTAFEPTPIYTDIYCTGAVDCGSFGLNLTMIDQEKWYINNDFYSNAPRNEGVVPVDTITTLTINQGTPNVTNPFSLEEGNTSDVNVSYPFVSSNPRRQEVEVVLDPPNHLLYNPDDLVTGKPSYIVEFMPQPQDSWSGEGGTGEVVEGNASGSTSRRRMNW